MFTKLSYTFLQPDGATPYTNKPVLVSENRSQPPVSAQLFDETGAPQLSSVLYTDNTGSILTYADRTRQYQLVLMDSDGSELARVMDAVPNATAVLSTTSATASARAEPSLSNYGPTNPLIMAHRGSPFLHPENSMQGWMNTLADPMLRAIECDVQPLSDGECVIMHDGTVDRTTTGTGNVLDQTTATWNTLRIDALSQGVAGFGNNVRVPFFREMLQAFRGKAIFIPEVKNTGAKQSLVDLLLQYGIPYDQVLVQSFFLADLLPAQEAGYPVVFLAASASSLAAAIAQGVKWVGLDSVGTPAADIQAWVDTGIKVTFWTVDRRYLRDALNKYNPSGFFTNDAPFIARNEPFASRDTFARGRYMPGMYAGSGSFLPSARGDFNGGWWGWRDPAILNGGSFVLQGWAGPIREQNWSITTDYRINQAAQTDRWGSVYLADESMSDQPYTDGGKPNEKGYHCLYRKNGQLMLYRVAGTTPVMVAQSTPSSNLPNAMADGVAYTVKTTIRRGYIKMARLNAQGAEVQVLEYTDSQPYKPTYFHFGRSNCLPEWSNVVVKTGPHS